MKLDLRPFPRKKYKPVKDLRTLIEFESITGSKKNYWHAVKQRHPIEPDLVAGHKKYYSLKRLKKWMKEYREKAAA